MLDATLRTIHENGLTINRDKCVFRQEYVDFNGHRFGKDGLSPDPRKVEALHAASEPISAAEVRSFLGLAQYCGRFIDNYATLTAPLRELTKQDASWDWSDRHKQAFQDVKDALSTTATTAYFDPSKETTMLVDASPVGLAAVLSQDSKPIAYASRALSDVEQRYSQTEREALAIIWGCEHFHMYVYGSRFTVITDHQPLVSIWSKPNPPLRIARWALRLQAYDLVIKYRPGSTNPADYMSRHPTQEVVKSRREQKVAEEYVNFTANNATPRALSLEDIQYATAADQTLQVAIQLVQNGQWHTVKDYEGHDGIDYHALLSIRTVKDELTVGDSVVLRDHKIIVPASLQKRVVDLAHEGHQGISKTKANIRTKVWFPGLDQAVEAAVRSCIPRQANSTRMEREGLHMSELPPGPWVNLSVDFCGPVPTGDYLLVITDEYSRYPIVEVVRTTSAESTINVLDRVFAMFGFPRKIKTDNGPPFSGHAWREFLESCGVKHRKVTPLWPQANAQAESFNKPLMKAIRVAVVQGKDWKKNLQEFLRMYRCTPHATTQFTPYRLMFGRDPRTKLPEPTRSSQHMDDEAIRSRDTFAKAKMKSYADKRHHAKDTNLEPGDAVLIRQPKRNKFSTPFSPHPCIVKETKGSMITAMRNDGSTVTRNASMYKAIPANVPISIQEDEPVLNEELLEPTVDNPSARQPPTPVREPPTSVREPPTPMRKPLTPAHKPSPVAPLRRSQRSCVKPQRLIEQV
jgi:transposase InsO family protein